MKLKSASLIIALVMAAIACQSVSTSTPVPVSLENQVLTAAAGIAFTQAAQAPLQSTQIPLQPTQIILPTDTPAPIPPTIPSQESIGKIGDTITKDGYIITLVNVETATQYGDFLQAQAGNKLIAVELLIESGASSGVNANPFYVTIKDANGYVYSTSVFGKEPALQSQNDMPIGEKIRGWITFEIPETATGLILIYEPISFTNTIRIRFDLGQ